MPLTTVPLPFGLRDVKLFPIASGDTLGTAVDLPNSRTFSFSETADSAELRGDDGVTAVHDSAPTVNWDLESGGLPLEAIKVMYGGYIKESGVTPNIIKTYQKADTDARAYFAAVGQAISDSGGDVHMVVYKCKATGDLSGSLADQNFWLTGASGRGIARTTDRVVWEFIQHETAVAVSTAPVPITRP